MRDEMQKGDGVLFYASNADPSGVTGLAEIARAGYPDRFAWTKGHKYFDKASTEESPIWYMVDIAFVERFPGTVLARDAQGDEGARKDDGDAEGQPPLGSAGHQTRGTDIVVRLGRRKA